MMLFGGTGTTTSSTPASTSCFVEIENGRERVRPFGAPRLAHCDRGVAPELAHTEMPELGAEEQPPVTAFDDDGLLLLRGPSQVRPIR